jgi:hypothetical protein
MNIKIKAIPVAGYRGLQDFEMSWIQHFIDNVSQISVRLSALGVGLVLLPRKIFLCLRYSFLSGMNKPQNLLRLE